MMEDALYIILSGDLAVSAITGKHIYPLQLPQGITYRGAIVFNRVSGIRDHAMSGATGLVESRYHVNCFGRQDQNGSAYRNAKLLSRAVRDLFLPPDIFRQTIAGIDVQGIFINGEVDQREEGAAGIGGVARVLLDSTIWHTE